MDRKRQAEEKLRAAVNGSPELKAKYGDAWDEVARALTSYEQIYTPYYLLERRQAFAGELFGIARMLVRHAEESRKPNADRLREYAESGLESLKLGLFADTPIYPDLETVQLSDSLTMMAEWLGGNNPLVQRVLAGKSPGERASELIRGSSLSDVSARRKLFDGGLDAVRASNDPLIRLALLIDPEARKVRQQYEQTVDEPLKQAYGKLAQARFAAYGSDVYPDATFTLRLAYGQVKGYEEGGVKLPPTTTLGGAYAHAADHGYKEPFNLPKLWMDRKDQLDLSTPLNFVSTADIIGGNSGSPTINKDGEIVGIIFDGNSYGLVLDYIYSQEKARAISVHSAGIIESLNKVYGATNITAELMATRSGTTQPLSEPARKGPRESVQ